MSRKNTPPPPPPKCNCGSADDCTAQVNCQMSRIFAKWGRPQ